MPRGGDWRGGFAAGSGERGGWASQEFRRGRRKRIGEKDFREAKRKFEVAYLTKQLAEHRWNVSRTAATIGLHRQSLQEKLRELGIRRPGREPNRRRIELPAQRTQTERRLFLRIASLPDTFWREAGARDLGGTRRGVDWLVTNARAYVGWLATRWHAVILLRAAAKIRNLWAACD